MPQNLDFEIVFLLVLVPLMGFLLVLYFRFAPRKKKSHKLEIKQNNTRHCPLCHHSLEKGQQVHSHVFPGKPDRIMHIFGCPYCYQNAQGQQRNCPRCKQVLRSDAYVIARFFEKSGRSHVHILGCPVCRGKK